jgi:hypothetical protein
MVHWDLADTVIVCLCAVRPHARMAHGINLPQLDLAGAERGNDA